MSNIMIIGVAGGTGSGKTTLVNQLLKRFVDNVAVLYHDNYYKPYSELSFSERKKINYDHPDAFDTGLLVRHLKILRENRSIETPTYDYRLYTRSEKTETVRPSKVIIVEGILVFADESLRSLMDIKIFVDTDADVRILRRILRDVEERGRSIKSVVEQYLNTVKPMHEQFVEPSKRYADIIVLDGGYNLVALEMIMQRIESHLETGKN